MAQLLQACKTRLKSHKELDEHRRAGHPHYSPDCPECKRGVGKQRQHKRQYARLGGELSVDIAGPYPKGVPVTDREVIEELWPIYLVVGVFVPYLPKDNKGRYERECRDRIAAGLEGPVQLETTVIPKQQTLFYVECVPTRELNFVTAAIIGIISRIECMHKCKAVYRLHADRARELTGVKAGITYEDMGISVTTTANYDSNANGRVERTVLFFRKRPEH